MLCRKESCSIRPQVSGSGRGVLPQGAGREDGSGGRSPTRAWPLQAPSPPLSEEGKVLEAAYTERQVTPGPLPVTSFLFRFQSRCQSRASDSHYRRPLTRSWSPSKSGAACHHRTWRGTIPSSRCLTLLSGPRREVMGSSLLGQELVPSCTDSVLVKS